MDVLGEVIRNARRGLGDLTRLTAAVIRLDALDTAFDLADIVEILVQPPLVRGPQSALEAAHLAHDPVEDAPIRAPARGPVLRRTAGPEQLVERGPRVTDHGQRLRRRRPADRVRVHAGVSVRAPARLVHVLDAELHGGDRRVLPEALRVVLVHRGANQHVRALGLFRVRLREEGGAGAEVVAADLLRRLRLRILDVRVRDDRQVVAPRLERAQTARREVEVAPHLLGRPHELRRAPFVAAGGAVHHLDAHEPLHVRERLRGGPQSAGRQHRIQERQRHRRTQALQGRAAGHVLTRDEFHAHSSWFVLPSSSGTAGGPVSARRPTRRPRRYRLRPPSRRRSSGRARSSRPR